MGIKVALSKALNLAVSITFEFLFQFKFKKISERIYNANKFCLLDIDCEKQIFLSA